MQLSENQVLLGGAQVDNGPYMAHRYAALMDDDITAAPGSHLRILSNELRNYLTRYFPGWRLLRRVEERPARYRGGGHYKDIRYVLQFHTDADAETVRSRLHKDPGLMHGARMLRRSW